MSASERKSKILKILYVKKHETVPNLAHELGVSERTIMRDIVELSLTEPIYTVTGRYHGGVYIDLSYSINKMYFEEKEKLLIEKIVADIEKNTYCKLNDAELILLKKLLANYSKPIKNKEKK